MSERASFLFPNETAIPRAEGLVKFDGAWSIRVRFVSDDSTTGHPQLPASSREIKVGLDTDGLTLIQGAATAVGGVEFAGGLLVVIGEKSAEIGAIIHGSGNN